MASAELMASPIHPCRRIFMIDCYLLIPLLVLECLSYKRFVFRVHETGIAGDLVLCELVVGVESGRDAVV